MSKKIRFSGMDLFIIIVIVAVIAAAAVLLGGGDKPAQPQKSGNSEIAFCVELTARKADFTELIKVGDKVLVGEKDKKEATVTEVEVLPAKSTGYDILDGRVIRSEVPGQYDVNVHLKGEATESDSDIKLGGAVALKVGQGVALGSKEWTGYGYVIELDSAE